MENTKPVKENSVLLSKKEATIEATKTITHAGRRWRLPVVLSFRGVPHAYVVLGYREPLAGEFYVSGAIPAAYSAPNNLTTKYLVVAPTVRAQRVCVWQTA